MALALLNIASVVEVANLGLGVECTVVGVHHSLAIHDLHKLRVYCRGAVCAIILRTVAIGVCVVLVDKNIAETLEALAHSTIGKDYGAVVVFRKVAHKDKYR